MAEAPAYGPSTTGTVTKTTIHKTTETVRTAMPKTAQKTTETVRTTVPTTRLAPRRSARPVAEHGPKKGRRATDHSH